MEHDFRLTVEHAAASGAVASQFRKGTSGYSKEPLQI